MRRKTSLHEGGFFYQAFIYLSAAVIAVPLAKKLGLGSVLGYLLAGVMIGPFVLGLVGKEGQDVMHFAEFGVVMMLFLIGLELQPSLLWKLRISILGLGGLQVTLTAAIFMVITLAVTSFPWQTALAIGLTVALSSTAIVMQTLNEKGLLKTEGGQNSFSVLLFQDIAVIPILALFPLLAVVDISSSSESESHTLIYGLPIILQTVVVLGVVGSLILAGKYLISPVFRLIAQTRLRELFTAAALLLIIAIAILMTQVGLSPALGTFLAGVVLAQSEYRHELETDIEPFKGLLLGLFFIAVGASIDFELIGNDPGLIATIVILLVIIKLLVLAFIGRVFKMSLDNNLLFAFSLAQGGEFAFVLFSFALQNGVVTSEVANPMIAAVAISMALTPLLMILNEKLILPRIGTRKQTEREPDEISEQNSVIIAGFGRYGSTIGRFLQANGVQSTYLDVDPDNVDLLRKMGLKVFYGDASRHDLLHAAGAGNAKLLIVAVDDPEKRKDIIKTTQKYYPNLKIISRSNTWDDHYQLLEMNIYNVYREFLDTSLRMGADALSILGQRRFQVLRATKKFRKHDENHLRELAEIRHEKKEFISAAKKRIEDLEQLMLDDLENIGKDKDLGWDTTNIKKDYGPTIKELKKKSNNL
jgi:CPA2 family monovalent cation:H+ antiporter-2/glutathione-regulated potassium-efflux system ancillary protein KefC/glutathione-regulated potassium-efflux system protein KefB